MSSEAAIGRTALALMLAALGLESLVFGEFVHAFEPVRAGLLPALPWAGVSGAVLAAAALGLLAPRAARLGALTLSALFFLWLVVLHGPGLVANLKNAADDALKTLAFAAAALVLAAQLGAPRSAGLVGRYLFGLALIGLGVMHFVFFSFTASYVPAYIPGHEFWAALTGAAQIAAGLAVLSGVLAQLAARLCAAMYFSWSLVLHLPRTLATPASHDEWANLIVCTALAAATLVVAASLGRGAPRDA